MDKTVRDEEVELQSLNKIFLFVNDVLIAGKCCSFEGCFVSIPRGVTASPAGFLPVP